MNTTSSTPQMVGIRQSTSSRKATYPLTVRVSFRMARRGNVPTAVFELAGAGRTSQASSIDRGSPLTDDVQVKMSKVPTRWWCPLRVSPEPVAFRRPGAKAGNSRPRAIASSTLGYRGTPAESVVRWALKLKRVPRASLCPNPD